MILSLISLLGNLGVLAYLLWAQRFMQLQIEQIKNSQEILALRDEQLKIYKTLTNEQAKQIKMLKEYLELLQGEASHEN